MDPSFEVSGLGDLLEEDGGGATLQDLPEDLLAKSLLGLESHFSLRRVCKQLRHLFDEGCTRLRIRRHEHRHFIASGSIFQERALLSLLRRLPRLDTLMDLNPRRGLNLPWEEMGQILGGQLTHLIVHCNGQLSFLELLPSLRSLEVKRGEVHQSTLDLQPLSALHALQHLVLSSSPVRDIGPLRGCSQLQFLDLKGCPIEDLGPLAQCAELRTQLRTLKLSNTWLRDLGPLGACKSLQHLDLSACRCPALKPLEQCTNLLHLDLCLSMASDFDFLASCTGLQQLHLVFCVHLRCLLPLASCLNLQHLNISLNTVLNLEPLWGLQKLQHLDLRGTRTGRLGDGGEKSRPELGPLTRVKDLLLEFSVEDMSRISDIIQEGPLRNPLI